MLCEWECDVGKNNKIVGFLNNKNVGKNNKNILFIKSIISNTDINNKQNNV